MPQVTIFNLKEADPLPDIAEAVRRALTSMPELQINDHEMLRGTALFLSRMLHTRALFVPVVVPCCARPADRILISSISAEATGSPHRCDLVPRADHVRRRSPVLLSRLLSAATVLYHRYLVYVYLEVETLGTWDTSPFGNDTAADFACELDDLAAEDRPEAIREALLVALRETDYLDSFESVPAVAAAALVAAQCPNGQPVDSVYGPDKPIPLLPADLRPLAVRALDRVVAKNSELRDLWDESTSAQEWLTEVKRLREVLSS